MSTIKYRDMAGNWHEVEAYSNDGFYWGITGKKRKTPFFSNGKRISDPKPVIVNGKHRLDYGKNGGIKELDYSTFNTPIKTAAQKLADHIISKTFGVTRNQTWALYRLTRKDFRKYITKWNLTKERASRLIDAAVALRKAA